MSPTRRGDSTGLTSRPRPTAEGVLVQSSASSASSPHEVLLMLGRNGGRSRKTREWTMTEGVSVSLQGPKLSRVLDSSKTLPGIGGRISTPQFQKPLLLQVSSSRRVRGSRMALPSLIPARTAAPRPLSGPVANVELVSVFSATAVCLDFVVGAGAYLFLATNPAMLWGKEKVGPNKAPPCPRSRLAVNGSLGAAGLPKKAHPPISLVNRVEAIGTPRTSPSNPRVRCSGKLLSTTT